MNLTKTSAPRKKQRSGLDDQANFEDQGQAKTLQNGDDITQPIKKVSVSND